MDTTRLALQMIAIQKAIFDNSFMSMVVMQNYTQNMMEGYLRYFPWLTQSHKKPLMASLEQIKQARAAYKQSVDQSFAQLEEMLYHKQTPTPPVPADPEPAKTAEPAKSEPAAAAPNQRQPQPVRLLRSPHTLHRRSRHLPLPPPPKNLPPRASEPLRPKKQLQKQLKALLNPQPLKKLHQSGQRQRNNTGYTTHHKNRGSKNRR